MASKLSQHEIVPDVLKSVPAGIEEMKVSYDAKAVAWGELTPAEAVAAPTTCEWTASDDKFYTLCFTDPDAPARKEPLFREFIHWVVTDIPGNKISSGKEVLGYLGPAPPCNGGMHRYCYLVYEQTKEGVVDVAGAAKYFEGRGGKKIGDFAEKYGLETLVATSMFESQWGEECDAYHIAMGPWVPPPQYQSESQKATAAAAAAATESKPELYILAASPNSHGPLCLVAEGKLEYDIKVLDFMKGETRTPEFMAKNPYHCCPTVSDGDFNLWESNAVMRYIADTAKLADWYPTDPKKRAKVNQMLDMRQTSYYPKLQAASYSHMGYGGVASPAAEKETLECLVDIAKNYLAGGKFLGDFEKPTIADLSFRPTLEFLKGIPGGFVLPKEIAEYVARFDAAVASYADIVAPLTGYLGYLAGQAAAAAAEEKK